MSFKRWLLIEDRVTEEERKARAGVLAGLDLIRVFGFLFENSYGAQPKARARALTVFAFIARSSSSFALPIMLESDGPPCETGI